jgi:hypothetical protein
MKFENVKGLEPDDFRRLTGVKHQIFDKMIEILKEAEAKKKALGGKPNILCMEDRLLMTLEYLREYRTYFHIATNYGISESACYRNIVWIENTLIRHPEFALPGRKELLKSNVSYETICVDATESPIERPKKTKNTSIPVSRKNIL